MVTAGLQGSTFTPPLSKLDAEIRIHSLHLTKCNAGVSALVRPVPVDSTVLTFYLPVAFITTVMVSGFMLTKHVPRWAGSVLILLYTLFVVGGWFL